MWGEGDESMGQRREMKREEWRWLRSRRVVLEHCPFIWLWFTWGFHSLNLTKTAIFNAFSFSYSLSGFSCTYIYSLLSLSFPLLSLSLSLICFFFSFSLVLGFQVLFSSSVGTHSVDELLGFFPPHCHQWISLLIYITQLSLLTSFICLSSWFLQLLILN